MKQYEGSLVRLLRRGATVCGALLLLLTAPGNRACAGVITVTVAGTSDPWLAGMPDGSTASGGDVAPAQSPVLVAGLPLAAGTPLTFQATGLVRVAPTAPFNGPDGGAIVSHGAGTQNGIAQASIPVNGLLGVFLDNNQPNLTAAPGALNFSPTGNVPGGVNYLTLAPNLKQVFFIGDGLTASGIHQEVIVPTGATRLFLGTMDGAGWFNNQGEFTVQVTFQDTGAAVPEPGTAALFGLGGAALLAWRQARRRPRGPACARLCFERLEDRSVPSTFTVVNLADAGTGSLRQAVLAANAAAGADIINFAADLSGTVTLSSGEMSITGDLTIGGPGASQLTVSGNHLSRAFRISGSTTDVTISGITITNGLAIGRTALGGGILNDSGHLSLTAMTFTNNQAVGDNHPVAVAGGGAVASIYSATLTIAGCTFVGNQSVANHRSEGGAILSDVGSTLTVGDSLFASNQSLCRFDNNERFYYFGGDGGAVATLGGAATFSHTTFFRNSALGGDGEPGRNGAVAFGGAINNSYSLLADGLEALTGTLSIDHSTFTENEAVGGSGGSSVGGHTGLGALSGGGAINSDIGGTVTITDTDFTGNRSTGGAGGNGTGRAHGGAGGNGNAGAILNGLAHIVVWRSNFVENRASGGAGGSSEVQGGNGGRSKGGAIHMVGNLGFFPPGEEQPVIELEDVSFLRNEVSGGAGGDGGTGTGGNGNRGKGGALSLNGGGRLTVRRGVLDSNVASGGQGGAGATLGRGGNAFGGGIANGEANNGGLGEEPINFLEVSDSTITNNTAVGGAGSVGGFGRGGGIDNAGRATATFVGTLIADNKAIGGSGTVTGGDGLGGGLYNEFHSDVTLCGCTVTRNRAIGGSGATAGRGIGGGIYNVAGGTVWVDVATLIFDNDASTSDDDVFGTLILL